MRTDIRKLLYFISLAAVVCEAKSKDDDENVEVDDNGQRYKVEVKDRAEDSSENVEKVEFDDEWLEKNNLEVLQTTTLLGNITAMEKAPPGVFEQFDNAGDDIGTIRNKSKAFFTFGSGKGKGEKKKDDEESEKGDKGDKNGDKGEKGDKGDKNGDKGEKGDKSEKNGDKGEKGDKGKGSKNGNGGKGGKSNGEKEEEEEPKGKGSESEQKPNGNKQEVRTAPRRQRAF
jgi:hypothetical protein